MKRFTKAIKPFVFVFAFILLSSINVEAASKLQLNKTAVTLHLNRKVTLKINGVKSKKIKWSTKNKSIAKVKNGKVTGLKAGKTIITAKYKGKTKKCKITVKPHSWKTKTWTETITHPGESRWVYICVCGAKFYSDEELGAHQALDWECDDSTTREETSDDVIETITHHKRVCSCGAEESID